MVDWFMLILTAVYVTATIIICWFNHRNIEASKDQLTEMKRQYDLDNRPHISIELIYERRLYYGLRVTNHGKRIATHVSIMLSDDFVGSLTESSFQKRLEQQKNRECIIGIGKHYDLFIGSNKYRDNPDKVPISGIVSYYDKEKHFSEGFSIDVDTFATFFSVNTPMDDLIKEMKEHTQELKGITVILSNIESNMMHNDLLILEDENAIVDDAITLNGEEHL